MNCIICNKPFGDQEHGYATTTPDKYEQAVGLIDIRRTWETCNCGHMQQWHNYDTALLEKIYLSEYRSKKFRGETVAEAYDRLIDGSENMFRVDWLSWLADLKDRILDIGSGIGVFPGLMRETDFLIECTEINKHSKDFITNSLHIPCHGEIPKGEKYDMITCVHVLEHFKKPGDFLKSLHDSLNSKGKIFIEVPGAWQIPDIDHDDFNSCHYHCFNITNLCRLVEASGFKVTNIESVLYDERQLQRIFLFAGRDA